MKNLSISIKISLAFATILGLGYVGLLWGVAAATKPQQGNIETLSLNGRVVGAKQIGQAFTQANYFWGRPSAVDYNGAASGASNKSAANPEYLEDVKARIEAFLVAHPYLERNQVPSELVTASASGLDPHIAPNSAKIQAQRIAQTRHLPIAELIQQIDQHTNTPWFGPATVNVLELNRSLDEKYGN